MGRLDPGAPHWSLGEPAVLADEATAATRPGSAGRRGGRRAYQPAALCRATRGLGSRREPPAKHATIFGRRPLGRSVPTAATHRNSAERSVSGAAQLLAKMAI